MSQIRGYLHLHSRHSYDGKLSLPELKEKCLALGMNFAAITEHTDGLDAASVEKVISECRSLSDNNFLFIPGFELPYKNCHILLIGASAPDLKLDPLEAIKLAKQQGTWIVLAHPHRNQYKIDDDLVALLDGIEIWNQQYDGKHFPRLKALKMYESHHQIKSDLLATAGLDFHRESHFGGPYVKLAPNDFSESAILSLLKNGNYEIERGGLHIDPHAKLEGLNRWRIGLGSFFSTGLIGSGKWIGKWMHERNLSMPKKLKEAIRKRL